MTDIINLKPSWPSGQGLAINTPQGSYNVLLSPDGISKLCEHFPLNRKVLIVTDDGVPAQYPNAVLNQCKQGFLKVLPQGESTKSFAMVELICGYMLELGFGRKDLLIAVGGGVIGDLTGFAAACYMRGIEFVGIPTTSLSQIDSSIGGKTGINLNGVKNCVGAFNQPSLVIADPNTLKTLSKRHLSNGLCEAVKAGLIGDKLLFEMFLEDTLPLVDIIKSALMVKKRIVEEDVTEQSVRRYLNLGHTLGHGIEAACSLAGGQQGNTSDLGERGLLHGEAVAIGMLPMIDDEKLREKTKEILIRLGLPTSAQYNKEAAYKAMLGDKKGNGSEITTVRIRRISEPYCKVENAEALKELLYANC